MSPTPVTPRHNKHSIYMYSHPLGVECTACGRRALAFAGRTEDFKGNMTELRRLRFKCTACGSRAWTGWLFVSAEEVEAWHAGTLVVSTIDGSGPTF